MSLIACKGIPYLHSIKRRRFLPKRYVACHHASMGLTYIDAQVSNNGENENVTLLVDSGASYTVLPKPVWKALRLRPERSVSCELADGTRLERSVSECRISMSEGQAHTPVILGDDSDEPLLGAVTLELLGLCSIRSNGHFFRCELGCESAVASIWAHAAEAGGQGVRSLREHLHIQYRLESTYVASARAALRPPSPSYKPLYVDRIR